MIILFTFFLPFCFSKGYPRTKTLRGGLYTWPSSLAPSRKPWKWLNGKIPQMSFNFTNINTKDLVRQFVLDNLDFNLNDWIKEWIDDQDSKNNLFKKITNEPKKTLNKKFNRSNSSIKDDYPPYYPPISDYCDSDEYPNIDLILSGDSYGYDCKLVEDTLGQVLSHLFIITPLVVISVLAIIFYFVFAFGRCCCFKPINKSEPNLYEIIAYSAISFLLILTVLYNFAGSIYFASTVKYILNKKVEKDLEYVCNSIDPNVKSGLQSVSNVITGSVNDISTRLVNYLDSNMPRLNQIVEDTRNNANTLINSVQGIVDFGQTAMDALKAAEQAYNGCAAKEHSQSDCPNDLDLSGDVNFTEASESLKDMRKEMNEVLDSVNISYHFEEARENILDYVDDLRDEVENFLNTSDLSIIDNETCDLSNIFEVLDDVPSFVVPVVTVFFVFMPIIMLVTLALQMLSFWYQNKYSRCCSFLCVPCGFCIIIQLAIGAACTACGVAVILYGIVYNHGDEALDLVLRNITNEDRTIRIGMVDLSEQTDNIIGAFEVEDIQIEKIQVVKKLLKSKVQTKLSKVLKFKKLPFESIAKAVEDAVQSASKSLNLDETILDPVKEDLKDFLDESLPSDLSSIVSIDQLKQKVEEALKGISCCTDYVDDIRAKYNKFFTDFKTQANTYSSARNTFSGKVDALPSDVVNVANEFVNGFLDELGSSVGDFVRKIEPALDAFDISWFIGGLNIIRGNFLHPFLVGCMYLSVSAHLYVILMVCMTMLLWYRRRGMGEIEVFEITGTDSIKYTDNQFTQLLNN